MQYKMLGYYQQDDGMEYISARHGGERVTLVRGAEGASLPWGFLNALWRSGDNPSPGRGRYCTCRALTPDRPAGYY